MTNKKPTKDIHRPPSSEDQRILALVRFIARRAAEKDYQELLNVLKDKPEYGIIHEEETTL